MIEHTALELAVPCRSVRFFFSSVIQGSVTVPLLFLLYNNIRIIREAMFPTIFRFGTGPHVTVNWYVACVSQRRQLRNVQTIEKYTSM